MLKGLWAHKERDFVLFAAIYTAPRTTPGTQSAITECFLDGWMNETSFLFLCSWCLLCLESSSVFLQPNSYSSSKTAQAYSPLGSPPWSRCAGSDTLPLGFLAPCAWASLITSHSALHYLLCICFPHWPWRFVKTGAIHYSSSYPQLFGKMSGT